MVAEIGKTKKKQMKRAAMEEQDEDEDTSEGPKMEEICQRNNKKSKQRPNTQK